MISVGTNDFLENYYTIPGRSSQYTIKEYENFLVGIAGNFTKELYDLGARKISLGGLPPMGCMPLERTGNLMGGSECVDSYNNLAVEFNRKLNDLVIKQNKEFHGMEMVFSDPYGIVLEIIRKPAVYGMLAFFLTFLLFFIDCVMDIHAPFFSPQLPFPVHI